MPTFNQNLNLPTHLTTRDEIREWVILEFLKEEAGSGTKSYQRNISILWNSVLQEIVLSLDAQPI